MTELHKKIWITKADGIVEIHTSKPVYNDTLDCWYSDSYPQIADISEEPEYSHDFTLGDLNEIGVLPKEGEMIECELILKPITDS